MVLKFLAIIVVGLFFFLPLAWGNNPDEVIPSDPPRDLMFNETVDDSAETDSTEVIISESGFSPDSARAVDDDIWRQLRQAQEYFAQGVAANQEASWEEAQFYLERALRVLADLDIDTIQDAPETKKYNALLNEVVADYRLTLLSLGTLPEDASPSAFLEKFSSMSDYSDLGQGEMLETPHEDSAVIYDVPIVMNDKVKKSIVYFQTVARGAFARFLSRSGRYLPLMLDILRQHGLPDDIVYLPLIESGFNCRAYSWAKAMGPWQFIASTGRLYGLNRNWWVDERRDFVKSTHAAARFLKYLYEKFGSWELALAAYNGGPGRVEGSIRKQGTNDFWKLDLRKQTEDYVPYFMAATIIAKNPKHYGFDITYDSPLAYDEVMVHKSLDLKAVAKATGSSVDDIKDLNPELLRNITPPKVRDYKVRVPRGAGERLMAYLPKATSPVQDGLVNHRVKPGETLSSIANKYGVSQYAIMEANNFGKSTRLYAGRTIIIPVPVDEAPTVASEPKAQRQISTSGTYTVRKGDNLWDISRSFKTTPEELRRLNYMERSSRLYVGQVLKMPSQNKKSPVTANVQKNTEREPAGETTAYTVRKGETLWDIAQKHATTTATLRRLNGLNKSSKIFIGQQLAVPGSAGSADGDQFHIYVVRRGDTLEDIAKAFGMSVSTLMQHNNITDARKLKVGMRLKINLQ